jgi:GNAT superfamily N-acetyltransferase
MRISVSVARERDASAIASLRAAVAESLTRQFGRGHWSSRVTEAGVLRAIATSRVLVARDGSGVVGLLRLTTKKPWAIDPDYFAPVHRPLYLVDMAVEPSRQRKGVGRHLIEEAKQVARAWPADAIWLDAYARHTAAEFYGKCGFREVGRVTYRDVPLIYFEMLL